MMTERKSLILALLACFLVALGAVASAIFHAVRGHTDSAIFCCIYGLMAWLLGCAIAESLMKGRR